MTTTQDVPQAAEPRTGRFAVAMGPFVVTVVVAAATVLLLSTLGYMSPTVGQQITVYALSLALLGLAGVSLTARSSTIQTVLATGKLGPWAAAGFILFFGFSTLTWQRRFSQNAAVLITPESIVAACQVTALSFLTFLIGYRLLKSMSPCRGAVQGLRRLLTDMPVGAADLPGGVRLATIGLTAIFWQVASQQFGYLQNVQAAVSGNSVTAQALAVVTSFFYFGLATVAVVHFRLPTGRSRVTTWGLSAVGLIVGVYSGTKEQSVLVAVTLVLSYGAVNRKLPKLLLLASIILFIALINPFNEGYRGEIRDSSGSNVSASAAVSAAVDTGLETVSALKPEAVVDSAQQLLSRTREVDNVAIIVQKTPSVVPHRSSSEFVSAPLVGLVPRALWPSKPVLDIGLQFSREYYNIFYASASAVTPIGDLYRHGGLHVALLGMLTIGLVLRVIDDAVDITESLGGLFLVILLLPLVVKWETDVVSVLAGALQTLAAPALAIRLLRSRNWQQERIRMSRQTH